MSKLPIISNGQLQQLVREPILQDKRAEHAKFQQHAHDLIKMVSTGDGNTNFSMVIYRTVLLIVIRLDVVLPGSNDLSLEMLHRANVVAQTKISFPKKQLLQLIQNYLSKIGLHETASLLKREANLDLMMTPTSKLMLHRSVPQSLAMSANTGSPAVVTQRIPPVNRSLVRTRGIVQTLLLILPTCPVCVIF